ncbi:hypothetical protein FNF27_06348 [Cafeteria roenbergensis]|uniref:Saccharopine dehydrogenase NADP binding domain-containing protein n=1 Tax=Cafeteria roenbergensis TaxID=33653 RepID=A0A5A8CEF2_CAFRO|nr:hypothetical protein FNF29_04551 [Cafeteria roenbergensis]KAA0152481.1 hypothetical protein FNF31_06630 [Cafeteria roenbergensis]KAA0156882.1 hypothetical protein FNF28_06585 [Cafeteria roenbergensis]KAA0171229.1 hypothetical protein FNF27_06348 [Cafeteria roenbergensis]|eukprot:KAA0151352.1 hypothetical protein FNF29_04551 [Cafeteria roenbergensis]
MADKRAWDIVVYGATGFTGRLVSQYLAKHAPSGMRIAIAGRSESKLLALRSTLDTSSDERVSPRTPEDIGVIVADALDEPRIRELARDTRVVIAAAGPFAKYGTPLARAAAHAGTHYADITGEAPWVRTVIDELHDTARSSGALLIPMSGFDSVPADLGAFFTVQQMRKRRGSGVRAIRAYARTRGGGMSGGTIASAVNMMSDAAASKTGADPLCMVPESLGRAADLAVAGGAAAGAPGTGAVMPLADRWWFDWREEVSAYAVPWPMEAVNTRCVRRSAALAAAAGSPWSGAGEPFAYTEWATTSRWQTAATSAIGGVVFRLLLGLPYATSLLAPLLPKPGTGPSDDAMAKASFEYTFVAEPSGRRSAAMPGAPSAGAAASSDSRPLTTKLRGAIDPYLATAVFVSQAALAMAADDAEALPGMVQGGGVLTPATALGDALLRRLQATGQFDFSVEGDETAA